jgi:hypothetical protein
MMGNMDNGTDNDKRDDEVKFLSYTPTLIRNIISYMIWKKKVLILSARVSNSKKNK